MSKTITITEDEYIRLKVDSETLRRLEVGGVDNWEWYGESLNQDDEESIEEFEEKLIVSLDKDDIEE